MHSIKSKNRKNTLLKSYLSLLGMGLASFLGCIDFTAVNTVLPKVQIDFHTTIEQLQWVINIFMLALSCSMIIAGRLSDLFGRQKLLYTGIVLLAFSCLGAGLATNLAILVAFRLIQGIAVSILYTVPIALISEVFSPKLRPRAIGIIIGINGLGLAIGPALAGLVSIYLSWRWIFLLPFPLLVTSAAICYYSLMPSKIKLSDTTFHNAVNLSTLIALITCLSTFLLSLFFISSKPYLLIFLIPIGVFCLFTFWHLNNKSSSPLINKSFFSKLNFNAGISANFFLAFFYTPTLFFMPLYLYFSKEMGLEKIFPLLLCITGTMSIVSPFIDRIINSIGLYKVIILGFLCLLSSALLQRTFGSNTEIINIAISSTLFGIGWAMILAPSMILALSDIPEKDSGAGMGVLGTLHNIGGAIGLTITLAISGFAEKTKAGSDKLLQLNKTDINALVTKYHTSMNLLLMSSGLIIILLIFLSRNGCKATKNNS